MSNVEIASIQRGPNYNPSEGDLQKEYEKLLGTQTLPAPVRQESTNATERGFKCLMV